MLPTGNTRQISTHVCDGSKANSKLTVLQTMYFTIYILLNKYHAIFSLILLFG
jgi:hypothetical protein